MTYSESKQKLCRKLNIDYTDVTAGTNSLFSVDDLDDFVIASVQQAWDYKPWTFTEHTYKVTLTSDMITAGYIDYPGDFEDMSCYRLLVEGVAEFEKKDFADFEKWFVDYPTDDSQIWAEHERFIFFNPNAVSAGQVVDISGKLRLTIPSADADLLPFSPSTDGNENSGNAAIVRLSYAKALASEKKQNPQQAKVEEAGALAMLDLVWKPMGERKAKQQPQNRQFFNTQDMFPDRRTRWDTNIGNFP